MFNSKKGQEMSVNVLVGIILGIIMLGAAMFLFFRLMNNTNNTSEKLDEQMQAKIIQALDSGDPVYVPVTSVEVKKGSAHFWVGIKNIQGEAKNFRLSVTVLDPANVPPNFDAVNGIAYLEGPYNIGAKESEMPGVAVNMKGVTTKVSLLVKVQIEDAVAPGGYKDYWKPKIVYIEP